MSHDDWYRKTEVVVLLVVGFALLPFLAFLENQEEEPGPASRSGPSVEEERRSAPLQAIGGVEGERDSSRLPLDVVAEESVAPTASGEVQTDAFAAPPRPLRIEVLDADGAPAPECEVRVYVLSGGAEIVVPPVLVANTDEAGLVEGEVLTVDVMAVWVAARHGSLGMGATTAIMPLADDLEVTLALERGAVLRGRLIDPDGRPIVGGALAELRRLDPGDGGGRASETSLVSREAMRHEYPRVQETVVCGVDGSFAVPCRQLEGRVELSLRVAGWGETDWLVLDVEPQAEIDLGDLHLVGGLEHRGRLVLPDGTPFGAPGLWVGARHQDPDDPRRLRRAAESAPVDEDGRFVLRGLEAEAITLDLIAMASSLPLPEPAEVVVTGEPTEHVVAVRWLEVTPRDDAGRPVRIRTLSISRESDGEGGDLHQIAVAHLQPPIHTYLPAGVGALLSGHDAEGRQFAALLPAEQPAGRHAVDLLERGEGFGSLRIRFEGARFPGPERFALQLANQGPGFRPSAEFAVDASTTELLWHHVPPGRYRSQMWMASTDHGRSSLVRFPPTDQEFDVRAGRTSELVLTPELRGRIGLRIDVADPRDEEAFEVEWRLSGATEWKSVRLAREADNEGHVARSELAPPGLDLTLNQAFAPGVHELRITGEGVRDVETIVVVRPGETERVGVVLERVD